MFKNLKSLVSYSYNLHVTGINTKLCCDLDTVGYNSDFYTPNLHKEDDFFKLAFNRIVMEHYNTIKRSDIWANDRSNHNTKSWKTETRLSENLMRSEYVWRQMLYCEEILCHAILDEGTSDDNSWHRKPMYRLMQFWFKDIFISIEPLDGIGTLTITRMDDIRKYQRDQIRSGNEKYTKLSVFEELLSTTINHYENSNIESIASMGANEFHHSFPDVFRALHHMLDADEMIKDVNGRSDNSHYGLLSIAGDDVPFHFSYNPNEFNMYEVIWGGYYFCIKSHETGIQIVPISNLGNRGIVFILDAIRPSLERRSI